MGSIGAKREVQRAQVLSFHARSALGPSTPWFPSGDEGLRDHEDRALSRAEPRESKRSSIMLNVSQKDERNGLSQHLMHVLSPYACYHIRT
jgi:hypothetical protein